MVRIVYFILLAFSTLNLFAQQPNDCANAIIVCGNANFSSNASGIGTIQEVAGCGGFEHNSIWIKVNIVRTGTLGFNLIPNDPSLVVDYDFWVYGPNRTCGSLGSPIRCCTTNPTEAGLTSNITGMVGASATTTAGPGANGNGFVRWLDVIAGQSYFIAIDRPVGDGGFEIQWTGSTMDAGGAFPTPPTANSIPEYRTCSVTTNIGIFDLNTVRPLINSDLVNNTITFHTTLANATDGINPLPNIYGNTSNPQTIYAKVKNNTSGCNTITTFQLKVYPVPDATITSSATTVCVNSSATISFTGTPNAVVEYTVNGGSVQSATLDSSGVFQIIEPISSTMIYRLVNVKTLSSDNVTTLCSRAKNITVTINVSNPTAPTVVTNSPICYNDIGVLTFNGLANATIVYTINGGANQSVVLDATGQQQVNLTGLAAGTYTVLITSITDATAPNCTTNTNVTTSLVVQPQPTVTISANNSVCSGTSATVNFTGTPNTTVTYSVNGGSNQTINLNASGTANITTPALTVDTTYQLINITTTSAPICTSTLSGSATILVTGLPTASISGTATICSGTATSITFSGSPGATVTYTVNGGANQTIVLDASGNAILTTPTLTSNTTYALVSVATTCSNSASGSAIITILSLPTATISSNTTICLGTTATIAFNGTPNATVTYTVDGGANQIIVLDASGDAILTTPVLTTNSTYSLVNVASATVPICNQAVSGSCLITVQALPTAIVATNTVCSGNAGTVTFTGTPNTTLTFTVDGGASQTISLDASGIANLTTPVLTANSTYQLVSIITTTAPICSQTLATNATVQVTGLPTAFISGTTTICSGSSTTIIFSGTPNATVTYTINGGSNQTIMLDASGNASLTTPTLSANTTYALVSVNGACPNAATGNAVITVLPLSTATISVPTICSGTTATIQFSGTPNAIVTYTVNGGANQHITLNGLGIASVLSPVLTSDAVYTLVSVESATTPVCTQMLTASATVTVLPLPTASVSANTICSGNTATVSFSGTPNAVVTYNINSGANQTITLNASGSATLTTGILTSNVTYQLVNVTTNAIPACSKNLAVSATVVVTSLPTVAISGTTTICSGGNTIIGFSGTPNAVVTYNVNGGANQTITLDSFGIASLTTPNLITNSTYQLVSVNGACQNNASGTAVVTIVGLPTASVSTPTICFGTTGGVTFSGTPNAIVTYSIDGGSNQTIILNATGSATVDTPILTVSSTYTLIDVTLTTTSSSCSQFLSASSTVNLFPDTTITLISAPSTANQFRCAGVTLDPIQYEVMGSATGVSVIGLPIGVTHSYNAATGVLTISGATNVAGVSNFSITTTGGCNPQATASGNITITGRPVLNYTVTNTVCDGSTLNFALSSNVSNTTYSWSTTVSNISGFYNTTTNGDELNINNIVALTNPEAIGTITMVIIPRANGCDGTPQTVTIMVNPNPVVEVVAVADTSVCSSTSATNNVQVNISGNISGITYNWTAITNGVTVGGGTTSGTITATSTTTSFGLQLNTSNPLVAGTIYFEVSAVRNGCVGNTLQSAIVTVNPNPGVAISSPDKTICSGDPTDLIIDVSPLIAGTEIEWEVLTVVNVSGANPGSGIAPQLINDILTSTTGGYVIYRVRTSLGECEGTFTDYRVNVNPAPLPILTDGNICITADGEVFQTYTLNTGLNNTDYDFEWFDSNGNIILGETNATLVVDAPGMYSVIATNWLTGCSSDPTLSTAIATVTETMPATTMAIVQSEYFSNNATITVNVIGGTGTLMYALDEGSLQSSNVFTGVSAGEHLVTVVDTESCTYMTQEVTIIDYPNYFTPNGDGINDTWNISGLNQPGAKLYIFDRYGKLLKQLSATDASEGWDGTYKQEQLPSSDYWFTLDYIENSQLKTFKAHFSLKR